MIKVCERCKKDFMTRRNKKRFCSLECYSRARSQRAYNKRKDDPEYKAMKKRIFEKWMKEHKEESFERSRLAMKNKLDTRRSIGLCYACGLVKTDGIHKSCKSCRNKTRLRARAMREDIKSKLERLKQLEEVLKNNGKD